MTKKISIFLTAVLLTVATLQAQTTKQVKQTKTIVKREGQIEKNEIS